MHSAAHYLQQYGTNFWDVIVVGGGPAGCSAAMVLTRSLRQVLLVDSGKQRNLKSHGLHNFITRDGILPPDFLKTAYDEFRQYSLSFEQDHIVRVARSENGFELTGKRGVIYKCRKLLLATGVTDGIPDVPGMTDLWGCAVFHCPYCDGFECSGSQIGLFAHRHNGFGMALSLRHLSDEVTLYTNGAHYLRQPQRWELKHRRIRIVTKRIDCLVHNAKKLQSIKLITGELIPCAYLFVHHDFWVNSDLLEQLACKTSKKGAALTNKSQETSVPGVYVAGDASYDVHFVVVAAAEGVKAAVAIHNALLREDNKAALNA